MLSKLTHETIIIVAEHLKLSPKQKHALNYGLGVALFVAAIMLLRYVPIIITAAIVVYIFYPVFEWLKRKTKSPGAAASLTLLIVVIVAFVPLAIMVTITIQQFSYAISQAVSYVASNNPGLVVQNSIDTANNLIGKLSFGSLSIDLNTLKNFIADNGPAIATFFVNFLKNSVGSVPGLITNSILFIYIFTALLLYNQKLIKVIKSINPLGIQVTDLYLSRAAAMTKGMVRGQFIIAFLQGIVGAATLWIAGIDFFAPMLLILSLLSIIPLGGGIVSIPVGVILSLTGNFWGGIFVLASHFLIVSNIDNILRPILIPKEVRLNSALTMLSVFSGIALFGFLGIIIGPVLMILLVTTIQVYIQTQSEN